MAQDDLRRRCFLRLGR